MYSSWLYVEVVYSFFRYLFNYSSKSTILFFKSLMIYADSSILSISGRILFGFWIYLFGWGLGGIISLFFRSHGWFFISEIVILSFGFLFIMPRTKLFARVGKSSGNSMHTFIIFANKIYLASYLVFFVTTNGVFPVSSS